MNLDDEIRRGAEARGILNAPVFQEAFAEIEKRLTNELTTVEITKDRAEYLRQLMTMGRKYRQYLEQVMVTGQLAEQQQTLMDKIKGKAKSPF